MTTPTRVFAAAWGAVSAVGTTAKESALAFRASVNALRESSIPDRAGAAITMGLLPTLSPALEGVPRLVALADLALVDLLQNAHPLLAGRDVRVALVLDPAPAPDWDAARPIGDALGARLMALGIFTRAPSVYASGSTGLVEALRSAAAGGPDALTLVVAVHTDHCLKTTALLAKAGRIWGEDALDAILLGEGAAALLISAREPRHLGVPIGVRIDLSELTREPATPDNDESAFLAPGLTVATRAVTEAPRARGERVGWISSDVSFEAFRVHELTTIMTRLQDRLGPPQLLEMPNQRLGHLGAAVGAFQIASAGEAFAREFAPAPECLCLLGSDAGVRAALLLGAERAY